MTEAETEQNPPTLAIEDGWLVEHHNEHTCGTGPDGHYGLHEPGCGTVGLVPIEQVFSALTTQARLADLALVEDMARARWESWRGIGPAWEDLPEFMRQKNLDAMTAALAVLREGTGL